MYVAISVRKLVKTREEAQQLIDTVKSKVSDQEKCEVAAQIVETVKPTMTTPCDPITS